MQLSSIVALHLFLVSQSYVNISFPMSHGQIITSEFIHIRCSGLDIKVKVSSNVTCKVKLLQRCYL